jgi:hypothetical protein
MQNNILEKNIVAILGIESLPQDEQLLFLEEIGSTILDAVLVRLSSVMTDSEVDALSQYLETNPEPQVLLSHIFEHYKDAESILKDVVTEFKSDAVAILEGIKTAK